MIYESMPTPGPGRPVTFAPEDAVVTISALRGGWRFRKRLIALGMIPGETVKVVRNRGAGPIVLEVRDGRLMIGRGEAYHLMVREGIAGRNLGPEGGKRCL